MPKVAYIDKKFQVPSLEIIQQANRIIDEYIADGLTLTLRQLYYQFVSRDLLPNRKQEYDRLGSIIGNARLAGLIDWNAIEDRTRNLESNTHWRDPGHIMRAVVSSFQMDHWEGQDYRVEVWIEKEALVGVIASICKELDVPYFACKGYVSLSEMWEASQRLNGYQETPVIIHLGDHDPSGIDMTRDIRDRQDLFDTLCLNVERIALNMDQIEQYSPPPNFAKLSDSRANKYVAKYGNDSWELDALEPRVLRDLIKDKVTEYRNQEIYENVLRQEREYRDILSDIQDNWRTLQRR